jgi:hypothetical protein
MTKKTYCSGILFSHLSKKEHFMPFFNDSWPDEEGFSHILSFDCGKYWKRLQEE